VRLELTVALPDRPGELLKVLEALASLGCNVVSIIHEREKAVEGLVPVDLAVDLPCDVEPREVRERLEAKGVLVTRLQEAVGRVRVTVVASRLSSPPALDFVKPGVRVVGLEGEVGVDGGASFKVTLEGPLSEVHEAVEELKRRVEGQGGLFIPPMEEALG